jgi:RNA polymerase sigma-70 factor (family 1)
MSSNNSQQDIELVRRFKLGDTKAFEEIYRKYAASLTGFASSKLSSLEEARDLIHDLFVQFWTDRGKLQITTSLKSYLFAITRHRIIDHIRRNVVHEHYSIMIQTLSNESENRLERNLEAKDLRGALEKMINNLPPRTRKIYQLSREENLTISSIAKLLNISDQTVKNQLSTALKYLRNSLARLSTILL